MKQTIFTVICGLLISISFIAYPVSAETGKCGDADVGLLKCTTTGTGSDVAATGLGALLLQAMDILTAGVGIACVGGVVYGAILYASAGESSEQTKKAKVIIFNVVVGVVMYSLAYVGLNFLIPGGMF